MISRTQIRENAMRFSDRWKDETNERAESQTFWNEFLAIFGIDRKKIAWYEHTVKFSKTDHGFIDVYWPGKLICEQKSADKDLDAAFNQALRYVETLPLNDRPIAAIVCDFKRMRIYKPGEEQEVREFLLAELADNLHLFHFLEDEATGIDWDAEELDASVKASARLSELHDLLGAAGYTGHKLEVFLVRLLFCFFAEDSGIFERKEFTRYVRGHSEINGAGMGSVISQIFEVLDTPEGERMTSIDADLRKFPYVNGGLFAETLPMPQFDATMTLKFHACADFDWSRISPSVFGSIFQGVMDDKARRADGAHYTTEENILKLVEPLFLDEIKRDLQDAGYNKKRLEALQERISRLTFFDPACGGGNFLTVTYKQLRHVEDLILERLYSRQMVIEIGQLVKVNVGQFYGIELLDFPSQIANVSLWLADHQANRRTGSLFGLDYVHLPLVNYGQIIQGNALQTDWSEVIEPERCSYILGNPPFIGQWLKSDAQTEELKDVWGSQYTGYLDYVTGWYKKAIDFFASAEGEWAFVSTNSITQGQPVPALFGPIFNAGWRIKFAHRTFAWTSEASGKASVHCIIVGFTRDETAKPRLFSYESSGARAIEKAADNINAYLIDGPNLLVGKRMKSLSPVIPPVARGSEPTDGGNLIIESDEINSVRRDAIAARYIRPFVMGRELINGLERWCLWLVDLDPSDVSKSTVLHARIEAVRQFRLASKKEATRRQAMTPHLFGEDHQPTTSYLGIPRVFSGARAFATCARFDSRTIAGDKVYTCADPDGVVFAIISSSMFITWQKAVGGRLKSDPSFSNTLVWNNLPLPELSGDMRERIIQAGRDVIAARNVHPDWSLAKHYGLVMQPELLKAHDALDRVVDKAFGADRPCKTNVERLEILFQRYAEMTK